MADLHLAHGRHCPVSTERERCSVRNSFQGSTSNLAYNTESVLGARHAVPVAHRSPSSLCRVTCVIIDQPTVPSGIDRSWMSLQMDKGGPIHRFRLGVHNIHHQALIGSPTVPGPTVLAEGCAAHMHLGQVHLASSLSPPLAACCRQPRVSAP